MIDLTLAIIKLAVSITLSAMTLCGVLLLAIILLIAVVSGAALHWHLYFFYPWLDIPMHLLGGFWVALFVLAQYYRASFPARKDPSPLFVVVFAVAVTMTIGLFWELFEFSAQTLIERAEFHNLGDTLLDLVNDLFGSLCAATLFIRMGYNRQT